MTPSPEIINFQARRAHALRRLARPWAMDSEICDVPTEEFDSETSGADADPVDRPTSALDFTPTPNAGNPGAGQAEARAGRKNEADSAQSAATAAHTPVQSTGAIDKATDRPGMPAIREIHPGTVLRDRYVIEREIGVGGTSTVFSARDRHRPNGPSGQFGRIAIKVLRLDPVNHDARIFRMEREFRHMQKLTHGGVVRVFDLDCEDDQWFITMELLEGQPLHRYLRTALKEGEALGILTQCAEALAYAHDHGIVHGDLKPSNVFVTRDGSIRLFDFGSAPDMDELAADPSAIHRFAATPPYASPETLEGKGVEQRDDLFSLACVAYELLAGGEHPFARKSSLEARQLNMRPPYVRCIKPRHFAVVARALSWDRASRPTSAREFLHTFLASEFPHEGTGNGPAVVLRPAGTVPERLVPTQPKGASDKPRRAVEELPAAEARDESENRRYGEIADGREVGTASVPLVIKHIAGMPGAEVPAQSPVPIPSGGNGTVRQLVSFMPHGGALVPSILPPRRFDIGAYFAELDDKPAHFRTAWAVYVMAIALVSVALLGRPFTDIAKPSQAPPDSSSAARVAPVLGPVPSITALPEISEVPTAPKAVPQAPGEVSFQSEVVRVGSAQSMAVINVIRSQSTRNAAPVAWSTVGDTALPGVHYESTDSAITRFNDGQSVRSLFIPLRIDPADADARPTRSFIVKLEKTAGSPALRGITQTRVIIEGNE